MKQYILEFDDRPDDGPRIVGTFGSREAADHHAGNVALASPEFGFSYEVRPLTSPSHDRPGNKGEPVGSPVVLP